jgi:hypothetical protein
LVKKTSHATIPLKGSCGQIRTAWRMYYFYTHELVIDVITDLFSAFFLKN